jgi:hypothetical protein
MRFGYIIITSGSSQEIAKLASEAERGAGPPRV